MTGTTGSLQIYPPLKWFEASDTIFRLPCLDVRGLTRLWSSQTDPDTIDLFNMLRDWDGSECAAVGKNWPGDFLECEMSYPPFPDFGIGPLFQAQRLEEKWDIFYCKDGFLYFCRSWTGQPILRAALGNFDDFFSVYGVEVAPGKDYPVEQARMVVDFLIKSHIFGLDVPVFVPGWVWKQGLAVVALPDLEESFVMDPENIAHHVFREYGCKASFAAFVDPSAIQVLYDRSTLLEGSPYLGIHNLKRRIKVTETSVDCPVAGCEHQVPRQKQHFRRDSQYQCPTHKIYISPSTFEYPAWKDNLLWTNAEDLALLNGMLPVKRENRLARSNSEDALTWNVFRYLEVNDLLATMLSLISGQSVENPRTFYWTYDTETQKSWQDLNTYRELFGELPQQGTEPDLILRTESLLCFIEAKFGSSHDTIPSNENVFDAYTTAIHGWYAKVFSADIHTVAVAHKRYQLMRQWLLGTRMADRGEQNFLLLTVDIDSQTPAARQPFSGMIRARNDRRFLNISWESIYHFIRRFGPPTFATQQILAYLEDKTLGYDRKGSLHPAFQLSGRQ